ncbi:MAG TPA: hypothetical protein VHF45_05925 [Thermoleophilaceae bacterium]|nr:hypothetical protein [Thermoleophilaceae bacterium]
MAYLTMFRIPGDPDELLRHKQEVMDPKVAPAARENGAIEHIVLKTDGGIMIVNLWETLEGSERTNEVAREVATAGGGPMADAAPQDWQAYEIVQREVVST